MRVVWSFIVFVALGLSSFAQKAQQSSLLWEISGKGLSQPSYLFGTFHLMCKDQFSISTILQNKLTQSQQFYGEIDMSNPSLQMELAQALVLKGTTLQTLIGADFDKVNTSYQQITGLPLSMFNNFKPFLGLSMLTLKTITCADQIQPESEFTKIAQANKIPILGLETIADQLTAFDSQPLDSQIVSLKQTVLNFDSVKTVMQQLTNVYLRNNIDSIYSFMVGTGMSSDFEANLLIKRNLNWIPVITKAVALKPSFFAVGAGHLGGEQGVISLLRKQGYTLTPIKY